MSPARLVLYNENNTGEVEGAEVAFRHHRHFLALFTIHTTSFPVRFAIINKIKIKNI